MSKKVLVSEIVRNFADYINRVAYRGERFTLVRGNKPVAELAPVVSGRRLLDLPDLVASLPKLSEADARSFTEDLARARSDLSGPPLRDPWAS